MRGLIEQILKFGVVGALAFVVDFGVMTALVELLGMPALIAAGISFVISVIFNYVASMRFVFSPREDLSRTAQLVIFIALSVVGLALNELIMWAGEQAFLAAGISYEGSRLYMLVKVVATGIVSVWNFVSRKRWLDAGHVDQKG